ncbi:hypothetical protein EAH89_25495 [Roseomonas nepalensis]|uniref:Uncharacterized protein n=1 Tax=Muricoccus nepalensis TaxID=1854500 RepID=A0A502F9D5_9PROT|nr:hypothetical protein EAH89_25495 [Roseomonas nepalensis]
MTAEEWDLHLQLSVDPEQDPFSALEDLEVTVHEHGREDLHPLLQTWRAKWAHLRGAWLEGSSSP